MNTSDTLGTTFLALADPVRRQVIKMLQERPRRAGEIAAAFDVSGPAISKHLRVLRRSNLIVDTGDANDARIRLYRLQPERFEELSDWVANVRSFWSDQLQSFKALAVAESTSATATSRSVPAKRKAKPARPARKSRQ